MRLFIPICTALLCCLAAAQAHSAPRHGKLDGSGDGRTPGALCRAAIGSVERGSALPADLLSAIGLVESGRRDPRSGVWGPWPWTIDAAGQPAFFDSEAEAIAAVRALQARGVASIDVGCMQVNLAQHPLAFASLEQAFDPVANVRYAALFLGTLFARTKAWPIAAALYHSATPDLGAAYQRRVMAAWPDGARFAIGAGVSAARATPASELARAWAATVSGGADLPPVVIRKRPRREAYRSRLAALTR